ncbi:MAG: hypothetical protein RDU25_00590 [Patescibacteria group bacterium]|nr:hypothetical protein [Patescibacteria group bacterium]
MFNTASCIWDFEKQQPQTRSFSRENSRQILWIFSETVRELYASGEEQLASVLVHCMFEKFNEASADEELEKQNMAWLKKYDKKTEKSEPKRPSSAIGFAATVSSAARTFLGICLNSSMNLFCDGHAHSPSLNAVESIILDRCMACRPLKYDLDPLFGIPLFERNVYRTCAKIGFTDGSEFHHAMLLSREFKFATITGIQTVDIPDLRIQNLSGKLEITGIPKKKHGLMAEQAFSIMKRYREYIDAAIGDRRTKAALGG